MLDLARELRRWRAEGRELAVATVIATKGSAPRLPGAAMAVDREGTVIGSVSGGCVEGAVYELCRQAITDGQRVVESFGYSDDEALAAGLTCGGVIDILVTPVGPRATPALDAALDAVARDLPVALVRVVAGPDVPSGAVLAVSADGTYRGSLGGRAAWDRAVAGEVAGWLAADRTGLIRREVEGTTITLFVETSTSAPRLIVFGATDVAGALIRIGAQLGYRTTLCDARPVFATPERFPEADEVVVAWPHVYLATTGVDERTAVCVLTHDPKFDLPLLEAALRLPVAYVGAMGSRRTHEERMARLREAGVEEPALARLRSPVGLHIGARTPAETAVSIAAEILAARYGGTGVPLTGSSALLHADREEPA